ncbi:GTP-binding protein [Geothermobacter ehrlichii]|uniref:Probable GTP-binding protein EngB n=1 Tax=Geothermobacter ehrlichii TaxID=213224 RepID=A0A5D3WJS3_9BACT|nr:ribosome biogenesis GTP-binding protein YihA/YsxC [Geothermobacter ehrlichii]TYO98464.1 GTP-binding protein [Geothermobacter ehrlichii]
MHVCSAEFLQSANRPDSYPPADWPEIAFAGRSNVGKSSLINSLLGRRKLVRTSRTPGRTQLLNFFLVNRAFCLVDLPGYGFARVPAAVRRQWGPMVRIYLETRPTLRGVVWLLDCRRVPNEEDLQLLDWLEELQVPTIPVITKIDKVKRSQRVRQLKPILAATGLPADAFSVFSALSGEGRQEVWERIEEALGLVGETDA